MESSTGPALESSAAPRGRALRFAALVAFVWAIAALPFLLGVVRCPTAQIVHVPCPGCGMTRAFHLLAAGDVRASLALHPLAVPTAAVQGLLAVSTIASTLRFGAPWSLLQARWGRVVVVLVVVVLVGDVVLWIARALGAFGGPVPV